MRERTLDPPPSARQYRPVRTRPGFDVADPWAAIEACYERGWTDGLPVVPPTERAGGRDARRRPVGGRTRCCSTSRCATAR